MNKKNPTSITTFSNGSAAYCLIGPTPYITIFRQFTTVSVNDSIYSSYNKAQHICCFI